MELRAVRIENYKCIEDSTTVDWNDVICLVGKNESGKTAFMEALERLNPVEPSRASYNPLMEYPRKDWSEYKKRREDDPDDVVTAEFRLEEGDLASLRDHFGEGVCESDKLVVQKNYANERSWSFEVDEAQVVSSLVDDQEDLPPPTAEMLGSSDSVVEALSQISESESDSVALDEIEQELSSMQEEGVATYLGERHLASELPRFVYFDQYSLLDGYKSLNELRRRLQGGDLQEVDKTFRSLLSFAGLEIEEVVGEHEYERVKAELEAASISITDEVFEYWTQNPELEVQFDVDDATEEDRTPYVDDTVLHVRIKNKLHRITVPFDERSAGFVWFFSFLVYFSEIESEYDEDLVLLLDEPGLNLHAKAQADFLRFVDERLAPDHQVVYTSHSPFMVDPEKLHQVRLVQFGPEAGSTVSSDFLETDEDTLFPLQAALGYDMAQTLFVGPHCLLVEGPSDMLYLQLMDEVVRSRGGEGLGEEWVIVPVGGADKIPSFVSLFGSSDLDLAVVLDLDKDMEQRLQDIRSRGLLDRSQVFHMGSVVEQDLADIEDMFSEDFFLNLVNQAYDHHLEDAIGPDEFSTDHPRIARRLETLFDEEDINEGRFNHYTPAAYFQRNLDEIEEEIDDESVANFESLFERINEALD